MYVPVELDELRLIRALAAPRSGESIAVARLRYKLDLWIAQAEGRAGADSGKAGVSVGRIACRESNFKEAAQVVGPAPVCPCCRSPVEPEVVARIDREGTRTIPVCLACQSRRRDDLPYQVGP